MNIAWQTTLIKAAAGTGGVQPGKPPRLSDDAVFCAIAVAFDNEGMTDAEQMKAFRALRMAGVLK